MIKETQLKKTIFENKGSSKEYYDWGNYMFDLKTQSLYLFNEVN